MSEKLKNGLVARLQNIDLDSLSDHELQVLEQLNDIYIRKMGADAEKKSFSALDYLAEKERQWKDEERNRQELEARLV